jgi:ABC-type sugar transport system ATPase subunit
LWEPDAGEILWEGKPVRLRSPKDSEALGITTIYQDLALCDNLDIVQNMFLGHEVLRHFTLDEGSMEITAKKILAELEVTTVRSVRQPVASLSGGQRQSVAVAKAVMAQAKLVIMDEPTAALGVSQTAQVLALIKRLAEGGATVLMISHNLIDVFEVADRIAILRLGRIVAQGPVDTFDSSVVVDYMTTGRTDRVLSRHREREREWTMTTDHRGGTWTARRRAQRMRREHRLPRRRRRSPRRVRFFPPRPTTATTRRRRRRPWPWSPWHPNSWPTRSGSTSRPG